MWRFIGSRLLQSIPVILAVITVTFFLVRLAPGGPFDSEKAVMPEGKAHVVVGADFVRTCRYFSSTPPTWAIWRRGSWALPSSTRVAVLMN